MKMEASMSADPKLVQVEIFGQVYKLKAEDDPSYVESLAAYVDRKMREVARGTKNVDSMRLAVLAALNIADEHHRLQRTAKSGPAAAAGKASGSTGAVAAGAAGAEIDRRSSELLRILDEAMAG